MPIEILLPQLAESMTSAKVAAWLKREGDAVKAGEPIAEVETDKTTVELEAPGSGTLQKIHVAAGAEGVAVGTLLAVIAEGPSAGATKSVGEPRPAEPSAAPARAAERKPETATPETKKPESPAPAVHKAEPVVAERPSSTDATPLAARMAKLAGLDLATVKTSSGRVTKSDVEAALSYRTASSAVPDATPAVARPSIVPLAPPTSSSFDDEPVSAMRRVTAARLQQAKQTIPHFYLRADCRVDALLDLRATVNARRTDAKVTITDFLVLASAQALRQVPQANAAWMDGTLRVFHSVDIAVAVNTPKGLITPVIRSCERKSLLVISRELKELSERARAGRLTPDEYAGGTFTISNLGMFGVTSITPIINPPQSCILGVGATESRPVVADGQLVPGRVMSCTLAADHRALDGVAGAQLLAEIRRLVEDPMAMALQV